ncbi:flavin-containing amine oxidoreductase-domain containing protein [Lasiosphaeria miniovina]|uniref:Flavin-containing amine oxidoreductase-domain containing protein n=1 Tax=Lasiosphaeria miniovina TaxID=1954250 RepID=A0AA40BH24_9PEZI|nr:flavin-containing amine oxidoreductase-domain containing protein [Lasiosphaeria miniovina]KAK0734112.1 flavin-containing amine oxidoreductase-domain containing protein [Lasiosphaeria miniovina]
MGTNSRIRTGQVSGLGKGPVKGPGDSNSRRSTRSSLAASTPGRPLPLKPLSPAVPVADRQPAPPPAPRIDPESSSEDIAPEIIVWTEAMDAMSLDSSDGSLTPVTDDALTPPPPTPPTLPLLDEPAPESDQEPDQELDQEPGQEPGQEPDQEPDREPDQKPDRELDRDPDQAEQKLEQHLDQRLDHDLNADRDQDQDRNPGHGRDQNLNQGRQQDLNLEPKQEHEEDHNTKQAFLSVSSLSAVSAVSDQSELSPLASPSLSSKATTPMDIDSLKDVYVPVVRLTQPADTPRRRYDVRPKVSVPPDLPLSEYAMQCITAAESSRLNPYSLHQEEYLILRDHISHAQVTTYLNIRNGTLRLWIRNPQIAVTREEAVGCAKDVRWFDVANVCFDWLVRRGYINFGCVEIRSSRKQTQKDQPVDGKRKTVVVIGAGMAGLGCARQLEALFMQYAKKFREMGEQPPRVVVLEGRNRIGGRVYSRAFTTKPGRTTDSFQGKRCTAEMGGMIITGFDRGNPLNIIVRGQLGLPYRPLRPDTTLYDYNGKPVDLERDQLVEKLYNDCLDRVSEYKFKQPTSKLIEGNRDLIDEGKDSSSETYKTIRQIEESTAAQPHAPPVSEQNIAPQVNLVPVSSDRATGRIHTVPGTPGALRAVHKAKVMGWKIKQGISDEADLDIESATKEPSATLGSVTDHVIAQYKDIIDLNEQDYRLMNWHIANLEYSNATNYSQLSLQGWDIDAGNEWEGSHTMVVGGYQSVPRGIMHIPTPLNVRQKSSISKITYAHGSQTGPATVECEDGYKIDADYVVNSIPLGVLKHGSVKFEPPLPPWKSDAIERLGFGVLNKVILVYKEPFWEDDRDIFGVLRNPSNRRSLDQKDYASQRGRFFQWFNVSKTSGLPVLLALMAGDAGYDTEQTCNDDLVTEATAILRSVFGSKVPEPVETVVTRWASDKFARGSYSSAGPNMKADDYDTMARPVGNLFFAGEHTCGTHPATVHGAYISGLRAASDVLDAMLGPIDIPTPLIIPKETSLSLKRKAAENRDPTQSRLEAYEIELWDHIIAQVGLRPIMPTKPAMNAYIFYSKTHHEDARKKLEEGRRAGKGKASANEVRVMSAKMWRDTSPEQRKPFVDQAEEQKRLYTEAMARFKEQAADWDKKATELKAAYEKEHPCVPTTEELAAAAVMLAEAAVAAAAGVDGNNRRTRKRVESYAETEASDVEMTLS